MNSIEQKLGFDRVRLMVAEQTTNQLAHQMAEQMSFCTDYEKLSHELALLEEMRQVVLMESSFPQQDFFDLTPTLQHLHIQGTAIALEDLTLLRLSLLTIDECLRFLTHEEQTHYPLLKELAATVEVDSTLGRDLAKLIDDRGELYDNASPELARIRASITRKSSEVDAQISHALARAKREGWAPEGAEPTIRNGRPVIPMLDTHRRKLRGLIQDESASRQTAYVEPAEVVELGNDLRELEFDERHEIQRILLAFSDRLRPQLPLLEEAYRFLARIDFLRAKARVAIDMQAAVPLLRPDAHIGWLDARHPLLYLQKRDAVVPFSLTLNANHRVLIISGPNAGGKSVCLKSVGLIQYMLQCGLAVPVRPTSECGLFGSIFIDIGDQQSIDDDLSTYTSHLQNMKQLCAEASADTLFLLDELGGGTEPRSGCAIAEAVLEELCERHAFGVATTHFADLKLLADSHQEIINGAMLFDTERMRPLYRLAVGHPGSSFAFEIAESIGFPKHILDRAGSKVGREQLNFEHQLQQLELDKQEVAQQREALQLADDLLAELREKYERLNDNLQSRRHEIISTARREAQQILEGANRTVERTISDIKAASAEREATRQARAALEEATTQLRHDQQQAEASRPAPKSPQPNLDADKHPIRVGTIVRIDGQDTFGQVVELKGKKAVVESGSMRMTIALDRLSGTAKQKIPTERRASTSVSHGIYDELNDKRAHFNPTLDLRGHRAEESIDLLHHFLDDALLLSEKEVRILHGKGYGILMQVIRQELRSRRDVRSFHPYRTWRRRHHRRRAPLTPRLLILFTRRQDFLPIS